MLEMINSHLSLSFHWKKKLFNSHPLEPNDFLSEPWPRITLHTRGQILRGITSKNYEQSNLERNAYAKRQMKKIKKCEVILQKTEMYKEKKNVEKCQKKSSKEKIWRRIKIKIKILQGQEMILGLITLKHNFGSIYPLLL